MINYKYLKIGDTFKNGDIYGDMNFVIGSLQTQTKEGDKVPKEMMCYKPRRFEPKHKKILKNFNFKQMVEKANVKGSELNRRIKRFESLITLSKDINNIEKKHDYVINSGTHLSFNKKNYCFELHSDLRQVSENPMDYTTKCDNKYIGNYIYKNKYNALWNGK